MSVEVTIKLTPAASRRFLDSAAQLAPATADSSARDINIRPQVSNEPEDPTVHRPFARRGRPRSTGSRRAHRASSSPEVTVEPAVALTTPGPSTTVFAAPGLMKMPIEVDLTQDSDEEDGYVETVYTTRNLNSLDESVYVVEEPLYVSDLELEIPNSSPSSASASAAPSQAFQEENGVVRCSICLDTVNEMKTENKEPYSTLCGHLYCSGCIKKAVTEKKKCPTCGTFLDMQKIHRIFV